MGKEVNKDTKGKPNLFWFYWPHVNHYGDEHVSNCVETIKNWHGYLARDEPEHFKYSVEHLISDMMPDYWEKMPDVYLFGARKYAYNSFMKVPMSAYVHAFCRHIAKIVYFSEFEDPETGLNHLVHALANLCMLHAKGDWNELLSGLKQEIQN